MSRQKNQKTEFQRKVEEVYRAIEKVYPQHKPELVNNNEPKEDSSTNECYIALSNSTDPVKIKHIYP